MRETMQADKMNLASLGNMTPHVHWHVVPRFRDDRHFPRPDLGGAAARGGGSPGARPRRAAGIAAAIRARLGGLSPMSSTHPTRGTLPFTDARSCKEWLDVAAAHQHPAGPGRRCSRRCSALGRGRVRRPRAPQVPRAACATRSPSCRASSARATSARRCRCPPTTATRGARAARCSRRWRRGYRAVPRGGRPMRSGELGGTCGAHDAARVRYVGAQMLFHAMIYRRFDPQLWDAPSPGTTLAAERAGHARGARQGFARGRGRRVHAWRRPTRTWC